MSKRASGKISWTMGARWPAALLLLGVMVAALACSQGQARQNETSGQLAGAGQGTPAPTEGTAPSSPAPPAPALSTPLPKRTPVPKPVVTRDPSAQYIPWYTKVEVYEGKVVVQDTSFAGEEIYFTVYNYGEEPHDVAVVRWDGDPAALPVDPATNQVALQDLAGHWQVLDAGESEVFEIEPIAPGRYVMFCTLPGHYQAGEFAAFEVQAPR